MGQRIPWRRLRDALARRSAVATPGRPASQPPHGLRGQSLVEFALVLPFLLLLFSGAADLGRAFYNQIALENAVKEGALYGARFPLCGVPSDLCLDPNTVAWRVEHETSQKTGSTTYVPLVVPSVNRCEGPAGETRAVDECVPGDVYIVRAQLGFKPLTPLISTIVGQLTFTSESRATVINMAFDPTPGLAPTKLILGTAARNAAELSTKCVQPDPVGSPGYYRSPCQDLTSVTPGTMVKAVFREGDTITYRVVVRNNGGSTVTGITMDDSLGWPSCPTKPTSMNVGGTQYACTYARVAPAVTGPGITSDYANVLTVDGSEILPVTDSATVTIEAPPPDLRTYKFVSVYALGSDGDGSPSFGTLETVSVGRTATANPTVYYKIVVQNNGGQTATGFNLTDTIGALPFGTATCPAKPATLAAGATYTCIYPKTFTTNQTLVNTVAATATNVTADSGDSDFATVTVALCAGSTKLVPSLIGLNSTTGKAAWTAAGFNNPGYTNIASGTILNQTQQAFSCMAVNTAITVKNVVTP
jgi:uncharacterized repeat protein (TIGR01451 family)